MPVAQPVEERGRLLDLVGVAHAGRGMRRRRHALDLSPASPRSRRRRAGARPAPRAPPPPASRSPRRQRAVELEPHDRLPPARAARIRDARDAALRIALDADDGVQEQAHVVAGALHRVAHGVDEERRIGNVHLERRARRWRVHGAYGHRLETAGVGEVVEAARLTEELVEVERAQPLAQCATEQHAHEIDQPLAARRALTARDQLLELAQERVRGMAFAHSAHANRSSPVRAGRAGRSRCARARPPRWRRRPGARRSRRCDRCASARS